MTVARDRKTGPPPPRRSEEKWKTIGQVLAVVSGLLTVATSLLTLLTVNANHEKSLAESMASDRGSQLTSAQQEISSLRQQTAQPSPTSEAATTTPAGAAVRHRGNVSIATDFTVDLDSPASDPQWRTSRSDDGKGDLRFDGRSFDYIGTSTTVKLPASTTPGYDSCRDETGYENGRYPLDDLAPGQAYCVKTTEGRFAALRLTSASAAKISFDVTTYEK